MRRIRFTFASSQIFRCDFATEWFGLGVIALVAALWARTIRFDLAMQWGDFLLPSLGVFAVLVTHALMSKRAGLVAEYFLLTVAATAVFGVVSYLSMTTGRPLADHLLMAADRGIGFDWITGYRWLLHHGAPAKILQIAYNSLIYQGLYFGVLFGLMGKRHNLREMFWLVLVAGLFTSAGAALFPAFGPFKAFGIKSEFLPDMERLHGGELHFALAKLTGVVSFPSFHTTMALLYIYGFSRAGAIGWIAAILNVAMLPAIPFFGGHYLVDMFAGAAVAVVSVVIVRTWPAMSLFPALLRDDALIKVRGQPAQG